MDRKVVAGIMLAMVFMGMLPLAFKVQSVVADGAVDWWPMFHHDLNHTGYSTSKAPNTNNTLWNYTTGMFVYSSPAVVDGKVYVGSGDNNVYCLDALTGTRLWNYTTGSWVYSSPTVADGKVYVGSLDGKVYAFGPPLYDVTIQAYCYAESAPVSVSITMDGSPTGYNTPHTFTGLTGTHAFTVPITDPNSHPFKQWSTGETTTTITVTSVGTYTAYYEHAVPPPVGGTAVPINKVPVDKFGLLASYIALVSTILVATAATTIYVKRRKKKQ